jgi:hypothetical protein
MMYAAVKMEAAGSSETLISMYKTGRWHFLEDGHVEEWGFFRTELLDYVMELLLTFLNPCAAIPLRLRFV